MGDEAVGRIDEIVVDCLDPARLATFWAAMFGTDAVLRDSDWAIVRDPATGGKIAFQQVPEPKQGKNRLHLDVAVPELVPARDRCAALGATSVGPPVDDDHGTFQVMLDPEGNEFCLVIQAPVGGP